MDLIKRLRGIAIRQELTDEVEKQRSNTKKEFAILTNETLENQRFSVHKKFPISQCFKSYIWKNSWRIQRIQTATKEKPKFARSYD